MPLRVPVAAQVGAVVEQQLLHLVGPARNLPLIVDT